MLRNEKSTHWDFEGITPNLASVRGVLAHPKLVLTPHFLTIAE